MIKNLFIAGYATHGKSTFAKIITNGNLNNFKYKLYGVGSTRTSFDFDYDLDSGSSSHSDSVPNSVDSKHIISFANILKDEICMMNNINRLELDQNKEKYRHLLIERAKTIRESNPNYFVDTLLNKFSLLKKCYIIDDFRYINEFYRAIDLGWNFNTLRVHDFNKPIPASNRIEEHNLDDIITDYIVLMRDTTLDDFYKQFPQYRHVEINAL